MAISQNKTKTLECRCTRCKFNNSGSCGYQGRVVINSNGECDIMEAGVGGPGGPGGPLGQGAE